MKTLKLTRSEFSEKLARLLQETYPTMAPEMIRAELDLQLSGKGHTPTIVGMFVKDNLEKIEIIE